MKESPYEKTKEKVHNFLSEKWSAAFEMWLECIIDLSNILRDSIPPDPKTGIPDALVYEAGVRSGKRICGWLFDYFSLGKLGIKERTYYTDAFFSMSGMGTIEFLKEEGGRVLRFRGGTYIAKHMGRTGRKTCHFVAGFIAGATSRMVGKEFVAEEVRCFSEGNENCDFLVKPQ